VAVWADRHLADLRALRLIDMRILLREALTVAIAGATMFGLVSLDGATDPQLTMFGVIIIAAASVGVIARVRRRARLDHVA
jgi:hypothetical protein